MNAVYFEDLEAGANFTTGEIIVDRGEMLAYNRRNDPWPFHVDEEAAKRTLYGSLIASGGYTITLMYRLAHEIYNVPGRPWALLGAMEWQVAFPAPVRPADHLRLRLTVEDKRESSRPGRGVIRLRYELLKRGDAAVLSVRMTGLIARRPGA